MSILQTLISPISNENFLSHYWTKKELLSPGQRNRFTELFNWDVYNTILNSHYTNLTHPEIRLAKHGKIIPASEITKLVINNRGDLISQVSPDKIARLCLQGATLIVSNVNSYTPEMHSFANSLEQEVCERVHINTYCALTKNQGFALHYDTQEAFIIQVEGSKEWKLYDFTFAFPIEGQFHYHAEKPTSVPRTITLTKGDVLYIPRGMWHSATADEPSLHLTVGIYCRTGLDLMKWLTVAMTDYEQMRKNLPINYSPVTSPGYQAEDLKGRLEDLLSIISDLLNQETLASKFNHFCAATEKPISTFSFPFMPSDEKVTGETV